STERALATQSCRRIRGKWNGCCKTEPSGHGRSRGSRWPECVAPSAFELDDAPVVRKRSAQRFGVGCSRQRADLAQSFVQGDRDCVGKIQRAHAAQRRDAEHGIGASLEQTGVEARALLTEHEDIARLEGDVEIAALRLTAEEPAAVGPAVGSDDPFCVGERGMLRDADHVPVVEPRPAYGVLVDAEAEPSYEVQRTARGRTQSADIPGVRWYF